MSKDALLSVRVDSDLKNDVEEILDELGIPLSTAISMYFKQIKINNGIQFLPLTTSAKKNINTIKGIDTLKEIKSRLNSRNEELNFDTTKKHKLVKPEFLSDDILIIYIDKDEQRLLDNFVGQGNRKKSITINEISEFNIDSSQYGLIYIVVNYNNQYDIVTAQEIIRRINEVNKSFVITITYNCRDINDNIFKKYNTAILCTKNIDVIFNLQLSRLVAGMNKIVNKCMLEVFKSHFEEQAINKNIYAEYSIGMGEKRNIEAVGLLMRYIEDIDIKYSCLFISANSKLEWDEVDQIRDLFRVSKNFFVDPVPIIDDKLNDDISLEFIAFD